MRSQTLSRVYGNLGNQTCSETVVKQLKKNPTSYTVPALFCDLYWNTGLTEELFYFHVAPMGHDKNNQVTSTIKRFSIYYQLHTQPKEIP